MTSLSITSNHTSQKKSLTSNSSKKFPAKLHDMMTFVESKGLDNIIGWVMDGRGIMIRDPEKLVALLPFFFQQTKYRSFRRQLNMWHFDRLLDGQNKGAFTHPLFVRGKKNLCSQMSRQLPQHLSNSQSSERMIGGTNKSLNVLEIMNLSPSGAVLDWRGGVTSITNSTNAGTKLSLLPVSCSSSEMQTNNFTKSSLDQSLEPTPIKYPSRLPQDETFPTYLPPAANIFSSSFEEAEEGPCKKENSIHDMFPRNSFDSLRSSLKNSQEMSSGGLFEPIPLAGYPEDNEHNVSRSLATLLADALDVSIFDKLN